MSLPPLARLGPVHPIPEDHVSSTKPSAPGSAPASSDAVKGSVKEAIGKLIGDRQVEAEGRSQQDPPVSDDPPEARPKSDGTSPKTKTNLKP
ncbi:hypothetical protein CRT23_25205 [Methylobacterium sp. V23]|nr:hypothetical protein CRT23_25205 [Methylobacterium sp. V23]